MGDDKNSIVFFRQSAKTLNIVGIWQDSNHINIKQRNVTGALVLLVCGLVSVCAFSGYFDLQIKEDVAETQRALCVSIAVFLCTTKIFSMWNSVGEIKRCLGWLQEFSGSFDNQIFIKYALRMYRIFFIVGIIAAMLALCTFVCLPVIENTRSLPMVTKNPVQILDILQSPAYEILYVYQIVSLIVIGTSIVACDTLFCGTILLIAAFLKTINAVFEETFLNGSKDNMIDKEKKKVMIRIIESYIETIRIIDFVTDIFSLVSLGTLLYNMIITGLALYLACSVPFNTVLFWCMVSSLFFEIFQLGIYCFFGEAVVTQNEKLRCNIYQSEWYNQTQSFKVMILLTLQRTEREPFITAGKLVPLCNETFAKVLKMAYLVSTFLYSFREA